MNQSTNVIVRKEKRAFSYNVIFKGNWKQNFINDLSHQNEFDRDKFINEGLR